MIEPAVQHFAGRDGVPLAYREVGEGRPLVLIHGYFSTATVNWIKYGHAERIAAGGFRVLMPDLRAHGDSGKPHDPAAYPPDVLADDAFAFLDHLGLRACDVDLGGYSLGGRTVVRMLARGAVPRRAVVAGMGFESVVNANGSTGYFRRVLLGLGEHPRGTPEWRAEQFLRSVGGDPVALLAIMDTNVDTTPGELAAIEVPTLVVMGEQDDDQGSGSALAQALPHGHFVSVPGSHMSAVAKPQLGIAIADFLTAH